MRFYTSHSLILAAFVAIAPLSIANAQVAAKVNGIEIPQSDVAIMEKELAAAFAQIPEEKRKDAVISYLIDLKLLGIEGKKQQLDATPEYKTRMALSQDRVMGEVLLDINSKKTVSDAAIKEFYDKQVKEAPKEIEVSARHILVDKEDDAKDIIKQLKKGSDFAKLAGEKSKDPGSKVNGGDLGYFVKEAMVPEFAEAAFKLEKGKMSETPVKSDFGFHVIKLDDKREKAAPSFDSVKEQIRSVLERKGQAELLEKLRKDAKIERSTDEKMVEPKK